MIIDHWCVNRETFLHIDIYLLCMDSKQLLIELPRPAVWLAAPALFQGFSSPFGHIASISCWSLVPFVSPVVALCTPCSHLFLNMSSSGGLNCSELSVLIDWLASRLFLLVILLDHYRLIMVYWWCLETA